MSPAIKQIVERTCRPFSVLNRRPRVSCCAVSPEALGTSGEDGPQPDSDMRRVRTSVRAGVECGGQAGEVAGFVHLGAGVRDLLGAAGLERADEL